MPADSTLIGKPPPGREDRREGEHDSRDEPAFHLNTAAHLLDAVRSGDDPGPFANALASADPGALATELNEDGKKKAFWINLYNAYAQLLPGDGPSWLGDRAAWAGLWKRGIRVAGHEVSLNFVEHGLLRRSRVWWALGWLRKPWTTGFERRLRVDRLDPRIHFALNCVAASCPPIRHYAPAEIDKQLDLATRAYLERTVEYHTVSGVLTLPALFRMYRGDFGGKAGSLRFLSRYGRFLDPSSPPRIRYARFDRRRLPGNFA